MEYGVVRTYVRFFFVTCGSLLSEIINDVKFHVVEGWNFYAH